MISFKDFRHIDIRIGEVVEAEVPQWSHWVMRLKVDFGKKIGVRTAFAGIMKFFKSEDLVGIQFPFVVNLEPKKIGPEKEVSECMMLMAVPNDDENTSPILFSLRDKVDNGTRVG